MICVALEGEVSLELLVCGGVYMKAGEEYRTYYIPKNILCSERSWKAVLRLNDTSVKTASHRSDV